MKIENLISGIEVLLVVGSNSVSVDHINFDSRNVNPNSLFISAKGIENDGHDYIDEAIKNGAKAIVHQSDISKKLQGITYIQVPDSRKAIGLIAQNFYDHPSRHTKLVGVTGTNGKTTIATLLFKLFRNLGYHTALISTVENRIDDVAYSTDHTTPDPITLNAFLKKAVESDVQYVFMECSSHGIEEERIAGLEFAGGIFTNLTLDHLDYHGTFEKYADTKKKFFDRLSKKAFALTNADDPKNRYMVQDTLARIYLFSVDSPADFTGRMDTTLIGEFNLSNVLAVYATAILLGIPKDTVRSVLKTLKPPQGRVEIVESKSGVRGVVDYAHTPDALENILKTLKELVGFDKQIITVVGCGGDRDKSKRPLMGNIATSLSDYVIFTSDNPRSENPDDILADITRDISKKYTNYECLVDRAEAIKKACDMARSGDIILVAGKGHETYQIFTNRSIHFSDIEELKKNFN